MANSKTLLSFWLIYHRCQAHTHAGELVGKVFENR